MKWHKKMNEVTGVVEFPEECKVVVGVVGDRALMCYLNEDGLWIDNEHGCVMRKAPDWWIELPEDFG